MSECLVCGGNRKWTSEEKAAAEGQPVAVSSPDRAGPMLGIFVSPGDRLSRLPGRCILWSPHIEGAITGCDGSAMIPGLEIVGDQTVLKYQHTLCTRLRA